MTLIKSQGIWHATYKHKSGAVCLGANESLELAILYCWELVKKRNEK